jgi:hypothetical protein
MQRGLSAHGQQVTLVDRGDDGLEPALTPLPTTSDGQRREDDADEEPPCRGGRVDAQGPTTIGRPSPGIIHCFLLSQLSEVAQAGHPETGAEAQVCLDEPGQARGRGGGDGQAQCRRGICGQEDGTKGDRASDAQVPDPPAATNLRWADVADPGLVGAGCSFQVLDHAPSIGYV